MMYATMSIWRGAGFADRIVGEDGKPTCHYVDEEGNEHLGKYDLVPILDRFVDEHLTSP